jgi:hypothetical protein
LSTIKNSINIVNIELKSTLFVVLLKLSLSPSTLPIGVCYCEKWKVSSYLILISIISTSFIKFFSWLCLVWNSIEVIPNTMDILWVCQGWKTAHKNYGPQEFEFVWPLFNYVVVGDVDGCINFYYIGCEKNYKTKKGLNLQN